MITLVKRSGLGIVQETLRPGSGSTPLRRKASEEIAQRIVSDIVEHELQPGARLVAEADMIAHYGVSRETLREALRILEVQGFLSIRRGPGGGPTVEAVNPVFLARTSALDFHLAGATYDEVFAAWRQMEPPMAGLAAANPDRARVRELITPFLDAAAVAAGETPSLHAVLAELSGNKVVHLLVRSIGLIITNQILDSLPVDEVRALAAANCAEIAEAVLKGHKRRATDLMDARIGHVTDVYRARFPERMDDPIQWR